MNVFPNVEPALLAQSSTTGDQQSSLVFVETVIPLALNASIMEQLVLPTASVAIKEIISSIQQELILEHVLLNLMKTMP